MTVHIYRSFYKGTRLLCGGGCGGRGVRNRVVFSLIFVSIFDRNDFEIISKLERIDKNSSFFNEEMANGKREKKKNSTIKLIFRSKLFNQAIYLSVYNVDRTFQVHFIPTRCKEGSGNILKYQLVFNGTGQSFEIFAAFVSRIKGRYRFIQSFLICTRAHHSRETIPFLINETRVKASVQLNGSPLRPTPLNFIPGPQIWGKNWYVLPLVFTIVFTILFHPLVSSDLGFEMRQKSSGSSWKIIRHNFRDYHSPPLQRKKEGEI